MIPYDLGPYRLRPVIDLGDSLVLESKVGRRMMNPGVWEIIDLIHSIDVSLFPMPLTIEIGDIFFESPSHLHPMVKIQIIVTAKVRSRDNPREPTTLRNSHEIFIPFDAHTRPYIIRFMHGILKEVVLHELDESILIGGERLFDPHKNER